ncbi:cyclase family protein [Ruminococcus sp.]|jgi:arylformamidase|uniref:cyclase family protein n=1 Tax=Ruminococcus sp. TaxID=41978 RepID=UPI00386F5620
MLIYDITREVFEAPVYPGDPKPSKRFIKSIGDDSTYNLSAVNLCTHTGTHIDAPLHFDEEGADIGSMKPSCFYGKCTVVTIDGILTGEDMERLLPHCNKRLIFHGSGKAFLSVSAARVIADSKLRLVGTDAMSIAPPFDEMMPHLELARAGIAVLEGLFLEGVEDGEYTLSALPLKMKGLEASPCRAVLMREPKGY